MGDTPLLLTLVLMAAVSIGLIGGGCRMDRIEARLAALEPTPKAVCPTCGRVKP